MDNYRCSTHDVLNCNEDDCKEIASLHAQLTEAKERAAQAEQERDLLDAALGDVTQREQLRRELAAEKARAAKAEQERDAARAEVEDINAKWIKNAGELCDQRDAALARADAGKALLERLAEKDRALRDVCIFLDGYPEESNTKDHDEVLAIVRRALTPADSREVKS